MSEVALLLANTNRPQQVEDHVRGCTPSSKYWPTSTGWRLCQRLHYFYQILTAFNKLKIMSEVVLLLANTDRPQQVEDYVRDCTTFIKYWRFQQFEDFLRGCTTSTKYWPPSTSWRLCQRLHYFYQILTFFNKLKIMSEVALLLANTDRPQQVEDYVRGCTTSTKYWPPSTSWRLCLSLHYFYQILTISTCWRLSQRLHYFYQILTISTNWRLCERLHYFYQILTISTSWRLSQRQHMPIKKG